VAALGIWVFLGAQREQSVLVGLACAAAILPLARIERQEKLRVPSWLVLLGAASYALYLVHSLAISIVARLVPGFWFVIIPAGVAGSLMAGLGYYWLVERKLLTLFGGKFMFRSTRNPHRAAGTP
jgi:peptidoglycan/LPS O-acetylase OafA/YrhL